MKPGLLKTILVTIGMALAAVVYADIPALDAYDSYGVVALLALGAVTGVVFVRDAKKPPPGMTALVLAVLVTPGCGFQWPKTLDTVKDCAPAPKPLIDQVFAILSRDGFDGEAMQELAELGAREGGTAILCIVTQLVNELVATSPDGETSRVAVNGRRFLAATKTEIK